MTGLKSTTTNPVAVIAPTAGVGYFYPLPFDSSLRGAVNAADSNTYAVNIITLSISSLPYVVTAGQLLIDNASALPSKALDHRRPGRIELGHRRRGDQPGLRDHGHRLGPLGGVPKPGHRRG